MYGTGFQGTQKGPEAKRMKEEEKKEREGDQMKTEAKCERVAVLEGASAYGSCNLLLKGDTPSCCTVCHGHS